MNDTEKAEHLTYMKKLRSRLDPARVRINTERLRQRELRRRTKRASVPVLQAAGIASIILAARWLFKKGQEQTSQTTATTPRRG
jgi:ferric-dicitrate binding protein FerR (iron transport regulator)